MSELINLLESLPEEWCWSIGNGRLGTRCCIFQRDQGIKQEKRTVITEYGPLEQSINKCLERYRAIK